MKLPTVRRWWANHWQVLNCPCDATPGKHHYPTHADAIQHVSDAYAADPLARFNAQMRRDVREWQAFTNTLRNIWTGRSIKEEA